MLWIVHGVGIDVGERMILLREPWRRGQFEAGQVRGRRTAGGQARSRPGRLEIGRHARKLHATGQGVVLASFPACGGRLEHVGVRGGRGG